MALKAQLLDPRILTAMEPELRRRIETSFDYGVLKAHELEIERLKQYPAQKNFEDLNRALMKEYKVQ
jgi:hypothetical protein